MPSKKEETEETDKINNIMKRTFLLFALMLLMLGNAKANDLIVTLQGDSINCRITRVTRDRIYFTFMHNDAVRNTMIPLSQISEYHRNYFADTELPAEFGDEIFYPRFRFVVDGGWQYRVARIAPGLDAGMRAHQRSMMSGFHAGARAAYFFDERQGAELMFSRQMFGNTPSGTVTFTNDQLTITGRLKDRAAITYIGASYIMRLFDSQRRNSWIFTAGLGYMGFNQRMYFDDVERIRVEAGTVGSHLGVGYDIAVSENFGLVFTLSALTGSFRNFRATIDGVTTRESTPDRTAESLNSLKLSVGFRF